MKTIFYILTMISVGLISCQKSEKGVNDFSLEVSTETAQIMLSSSGGNMNISETLVTSASFDYYIDGELAYVQNGQIVATVNFGEGEEDSFALLEKDGTLTTIELKKDGAMYNGKKSKYKKVIVEPLVKSEDCDYIIAGIIKYFDSESGAWVATIDFGEQICDEWATKTAADWSGEYVFSLDDWNK